jgi:methionyl-tRNA formyltransferase
MHTIPEEKTSFRKWLVRYFLDIVYTAFSSLQQPPPPFTPHPDSPSFGNDSHLLITASFGGIFPAAVLHLFPGTQRLNLNDHTSLPPPYRGPVPIQRALMVGERETGVCVIEMGEVTRKAGKLVNAVGIRAIERTVSLSWPNDKAKRRQCIT